MTKQMEEEEKQRNESNKKSALEAWEAVQLVPQDDADEKNKVFFFFVNFIRKR